MSRVISRIISPTSKYCGKLLLSRSNNDVQIADLGDNVGAAACGVFWDENIKLAPPIQSRVPARISAPEDVIIKKPKLVCLSAQYAAILVSFTMYIPKKVFC